MKRLLEHTARRSTPLLVVLLVATVPAGTLAAPAAAGSAHDAAKHAKKHKKGARKKRGCHIPQGNVKDDDTDNHGGPSDGDGCM